MGPVRFEHPQDGTGKTTNSEGRRSKKRSISERNEPKSDNNPKVETPDPVGVASGAGGPNVPPDGENAPGSSGCVSTGNGGAGDLAVTADADFGEALRMIARLPLSDSERAEAVRRLLMR